MHSNPRDAGDEDAWVAASYVEAVELPRRRRTRSPRAWQALALGVVSVVCFGFVFGPWALALGRQARLARVDANDEDADRMAHAAVALGSFGIAVHLAIAFTVLPWLLFVLPLAD